MFGYVKTCTPQLRLCEWEAYRGIYCGLCRTLGRRFGPLARLTLRSFPMRRTWRCFRCGTRRRIPSRTAACGAGAVDACCD